jgi:hypothetical protein
LNQTQSKFTAFSAIDSKALLIEVSGDEAGNGARCFSSPQRRSLRNWHSPSEMNGSEIVLAGDEGDTGHRAESQHGDEERDPFVHALILEVDHPVHHDVTDEKQK